MQLGSAIIVSPFVTGWWYHIRNFLLACLGAWIPMMDGKDSKILIKNKAGLGFCSQYRTAMALNMISIHEGPGFI
jgi:hypothetical protein